MDFFTRQAQSRRTTKYLVLLFFLAFVAVGVVTAIALGLILGFLPRLDTPLLTTTAGGGIDLITIQRFLGVVALTMVLMLVASMYRTATLSKGGAAVARMMGGTEIHTDATSPAHQRLVNVVEEMSIASGVPVPEIFVLEAEPGINAFAAGLTYSDAAVAVTRGALERLNRAELQGVIAHEFSHILNGDMRINQRLVGLSFGILVLSLVGRWLLRSARFARRGRDRGSAALLMGLALTVIGAIGVFFSRLIKAAVSRQRELLADASAVQFTREPSALAGALKKIGGYTATLSATETEEVAHMLFGTGANAFRGWFATHPPLIERIRALEPGFDADQFPTSDGPLPIDHDTLASAPLHGLADEPTSLSNDALLAQTGQVGSTAVGAALREAVPPMLQDAAHSREGSLLLVIAMASTAAGEAAMRNEAFIEQRLGPQRAELCARLGRQLESLDARLRLPLLELAIPALKRRPDEQLEFLFDVLRELRARGSGNRLFGVVLPRILDAYLAGRLHHRAVAIPAHEKRSYPEAADQLLATVASFGHSDPTAALAAYAAGVAALDGGTGIRPRVQLDIADAGLLERLDPALDRLATEPAARKRSVLAAVLVTVRHDDSIRPAEIELFRAIAATLDCPVPPLVASAS